MRNIRVVGAGNMGGALIRALERLGHTPAVHKRVTPTVEGADTIMLAVKPNAFEGLPSGMEESLVISVMTGIPLASLERKSGSKRIIRAMPNLAVQVGESVTGWIASPGATEEDKAFARQIFVAMGTELELKEEALIDAITALSGSGPAYYFYMTEFLAEKAEAMGFPPEQAHLIAEGTLTGAAALLRAESHRAQQWRERITAKGGTTAAALEVLQDLRPLLSDAVDAAHNRAKELAQ